MEIKMAPMMPKIVTYCRDQFVPSTAAILLDKHKHLCHNDWTFSMIRGE